VTAQLQLIIIIINLLLLLLLLLLKSIEWKISWKKTCGKTKTKMEDNTLVADERMEKTRRRQGYLEAN
jgi:hypothetical protein